MAMARGSARRTATWALGVLGVAFSRFALGLEWNLQPAVTRIAADVHELREYVMLLVVVIFVCVFGFMFYSVFAHRKDKNYKAAQWHENTPVEVLWTVIPLIILVVIAWPAIKVVVAQKDTSNPDIAVKVTGYQWKLGYDYFCARQDAIPGFIRNIHVSAEKPGVYRGQCVERCGNERGFMPIVSRAVSQDEYSKWVGERKKALAAAADNPAKT